MTEKTPWQVVDQYGPLIVHECKHVWKVSLALYDFQPCDIRDTVQYARVYIAENWARSYDRSRTVAPLVRIMARRAALLCLAKERGCALPIDLNQFAEYAA